jgi:type II secretory pathway pseudopilin PulG
MVDVITGLLILVVLTALFATALARQTRGAQRLAESRAAMRLAERTLTALQSGQPPPAPPAAPADEGSAIEIAPLGPADGAPGRAWVRVTVTRNGRTSATLIGLARAAEGGSR